MLEMLSQIDRTTKKLESWMPNPKYLTSPKLISFPDYLQKVTPKFTWDWNYQLFIQSELDELTRGNIKKLALFMPPRHGKSELVTIRYAAWRLEQEPTLRIIISSYNQTLAEKFSRRIRSLDEQRIELSKTRNTAAEWETSAGGGVRAAGVGGGVTGMGADLVIIDDPVKNREEANSETIREKTWEWYTNDLYTRLEPNAQIILIMTRWHEDDLAGRILSSNEAEDWKVINFPAIASENDQLGRLPGEALCPDRYDLAALENIKKTIGSYSFSALYDQRPTPEVGGLFKKSSFRYYSIRDNEFYELDRLDSNKELFKIADCWRFMTIDAAATEKETSDYFVTATWDVTPKNDLILIDLFRERAETTKHESIIKPIYEKFEPGFIAVEDVTFGKNIIQRLKVLGYPVIPLKADRDKYSRALPMQARYETGSVFHKYSMPNIDVYEAELLNFPNGKHDDCVDVASYAGVCLIKHTYEEKQDKELTPEQKRQERIEKHFPSLKKKTPNKGIGY